MRKLGIIYIVLIAAVLVYNTYSSSRENEHTSQTVKIIENDVSSQKMKVMCMKDTDNLRKDDTCILYLGEDTTIRKMDGTVSAREDLSIGEIVRVQYASSSLDYSNKDRMYCINRISFILKPENGVQEKQYGDTTYISYQ